TGTVASTGQFGVGTILNDDAYFFSITPSVILNEGGTPAGGSGGSSNASFTVTQVGVTNVNPGPVTATTAGTGANPATVALNTAAGCPTPGSPTGNPDIIFTSGTAGTNSVVSTLSSSGNTGLFSTATFRIDTPSGTQATFSVPVCQDA